MKTKWAEFLSNKMDFFMENFYLPLGGLILLVLGFLFYIYSNETSKYFDQCLKDGKKEYECYSLIYRSGRR